VTQLTELLFFAAAQRRLYEKHGLRSAGEDKNPVSGIAVNRMSWRA
jgi:hypothetical protein